MNLLTLPITTAITLTASPAVQLPAAPRNLAVQGKLTYGSGGTTVNAYLQTSLDAGATWIDIAQFSFTTAAARFVYNLNGQTAVTTEYTALDGTLAANTAKDGILGPQYRVKYVTTGTYAGSTILAIDISIDQAA
jgi:hypothetical protein